MVFQIKSDWGEEHDPVPVTIPFVVVTQVAAPTVAPAIPLMVRLLPVPTIRLRSPVEADPRVRDCSFVVAIVPFPVSERELLPVPAIEAVGVPPATLVKANLAVLVAVEPSS